MCHPMEAGICRLLDGVRPGARLGKDIGRDCQALALGKTASGQGWGALPGLVPRDTGLEPRGRHVHLVCVSYPKNTGLEGGSEVPILG